MRTPLRVSFTENRMQAIVSGNGAKALLIELRGRLLWSTKLRGYTVTEATARDILAAAEARGWFVVVSGQPEPRPALVVVPQAPSDLAEDAQEALW